MIISHSNQFCYWKIPRTGSNTVELCIRMSGVLDFSVDSVTYCFFFPKSHNVPDLLEHRMGHTTPAEAIELGVLTEKQYADYDHYAIVREPVERWVSAYAYYHRFRDNLKRVHPNEFFDQALDAKVLMPQTAFLERGGVKTLPFSDYENSVRSIVSAVGGRLEDVPRLEHYSKPKWKNRAWQVIERTPELRAKILRRYAADANLGY